MNNQQTAMPVVDVREIIPRERHPLIFQTFDNLEPGNAFILVNDHNPVPLYYQLLHECGDQFTFTYLEEGQEILRAQIGKVAT